MCESQQHPGPICQRDFAQTESLVTWQPLTCLFLRIMKATSGASLTFLISQALWCVVAMIPSNHPKIVWDHFFKHWITPFGVPRRLIYDQGGEFERDFGQELEDLVCEPMPTAAITPQQNAVCERHGRIWKTRARRLLDEFSVKFVLTAAVTWACNSAIDDSAYALAQWVLGRRLRLPYTLLDQTGRLSLHERVTMRQSIL